MRRIPALLALLTMVVAPPFLLVGLGFRDWGSLGLLAPTDVRLLLAVLTVVGWAAWGWWLLGLLVELVEVAASGRLRLRLPGLGAPRALASALLAAVLAAGVPTLAGAEAPERTAEVVAAPPRGAAHGDADARSADARPGEAPSAGASVAGSSVLTHQVVAADDLWSLAERYYGEGSRWPTIVDANPEVLAGPLADLPEGASLAIPDPVRLVTVRSGDSLSRLAERHLGDADRWPEIHRLNAARVADPDVIDVGWVLRVPYEQAPLAARSAAAGPGAPSPNPAPSPPSPAPGPAPGPGADTTAPSAAPVGDGPEQPAPDQPAPDQLAPAPDAPEVTRLVGGIGALAASAVVGGLGVRRRLRERSRPPGRRFAPPDEALTRYETALGVRRDAGAVPDRAELLDRALRHLGRHWWERSEPALELTRAEVGAEEVALVFASPPPSAPPGFHRDGPRLLATWARLRALEPCEHPAAFPALVTLGADDDGRLVMVDLVASGLLGVRAHEGGPASESLSAMLVELACAPWASELRLLVVTADAAFARAAAPDRVVCAGSPETGVARVERAVAERGGELPEGRRWADVRLDPDLAEAWAPLIVLFECPPDADGVRRLEAALGGEPCGVAGVLPVDEAAGEATWELVGSPGGGVRATAPGVPGTLAAQTVPRASRDAIARLYRLADADVTEPAPWWATDERKEPDDVKIIALRPAPAPASGPRISLLGPIGLAGAAGEEPGRAVSQCIEYCAWLLEHPGATARQMSAALLVAEGTRRSNMSRLRTWLGAAPDGRLYLPDAYSGRIALDAGVTSDWQDLQALVAGGVNRMSLERLKAALGLVRGAPLADAAPGQWHWAEQLRSDMAALVRDLGVVAARLARERGDLDAARWAANRALLAAPDDELLLAERIRTEFAAGRLDDVNRLVQRVTRQARVLGVDLLPETVDLCQEVVEGRLRARRA